MAASHRCVRDSGFLWGWVEDRREHPWDRSLHFSESDSDPGKLRQLQETSLVTPFTKEMGFRGKRDISDPIHRAGQGGTRIQDLPGFGI